MVLMYACMLLVTVISFLTFAADIQRNHVPPGNNNNINVTYRTTILSFSLYG